MEMSQSTTLIADGQVRDALDAPKWLRPQPRMPDGEALWRWIAVAYAVYWILFVGGFYGGVPQLNSVGAAVVLAMFCWLASQRLQVRLDGVAIASLAAALIPILNMAAGNTSAAESPDAIIKHVSLCLVIAVSRILRLPPASSSRASWWLAAPVLVVLALCLSVSRGATWDGGTQTLRIIRQSEQSGSNSISVIVPDRPFPRQVRNSRGRSRNGGRSARYFRHQWRGDRLCRRRGGTCALRNASGITDLPVHADGNCRMHRHRSAGNRRVSAVARYAADESVTRHRHRGQERFQWRHS